MVFFVAANQENVSFLVIFIGAIGLALLFMPTVGEKNEYIPDYLHLKFEMKLFAAYILGIFVNFLFI